MRTPLTLAILAALAAPAASAVEIDGRIDPAEWAGARHITDFRLTQPLSREPAPQKTEAWILATEDGLAVAFRNLQDASVPRTRQRTQRDEGGPVDRVNLFVDFNGDGRTGYNFMVTLSDSIEDATITNENQFSNDWDGDWLHATSEDEAGWSAELLIPWHTAPMQKAVGDVRTIGIQLDRVLGATGERAAWPAVIYTESRYLTRFERIEIPAFSQALLAVTPYVVGVQDLVGHRADFDAGGDVFWKPSGQFQLSATVNPDFGQVESDQLVVNFGAVETFFSDKRPFFTENQSFFDVPFGSLNNANRLIYTRRVGGPEDDRDGSGDVSAALKVNGSAAGFNYGVFAADEGGDDGRQFYATRATREFGAQGVGATVTHVDRPFLDRQATVYEVDHRWSNARWNVRTVAVGSSIEQGGRRVDDTGAQVRIDHNFAPNWRQQLYAVHLGDALQLNDFGYLERNNFNYARYEIARRFTSLPAESVFNSHEVRAAVSRRVNDDGLHIGDAWAVNRISERKDGGNQLTEIAGWTNGHDDLILRGNGIVKMPAKLFLFTERFRPRQGRWGWYANARYTADGLGGPDEGAVTVYFEPTYHVSDSLSFTAGLEARRNPDWLLWRPDNDPATRDNRLATFEADQFALNVGATWLIDNKQELRVRLETIGLDARVEQVWRTAADGTPLAVDEPVADFGLRNMGFQVRYRYELAPLSHLYVAYVRGGAFYDEAIGRPFDARDEFTDAFDLRDSEQLLVKLSYRFEI
ncbi:DUF5916 domain-containing protein [Cognatilysobacter bugurensis]|uniref:DUF5916 domain-containing protein n=1 Tax=Cognatilysobacter bugurensis TaxID=543356 RepID=A0A918SXA2_9GAMM|nr:DUF5916 domain-containing protein [Lysobacter bugurensis]GHA77126.1 hypothetical protein GCM10007067_13050 [Lysobacter bugurensis]